MIGEFEMLCSVDVTTAGCLRQYAKMMDLDRPGAPSGTGVDGVDVLQQLLAAMPGNQDAMDGFARVNAGVTSPSEFFSPQNVERIMSQAGAVTAVH